MKKRIKRALAAFLKDELEEYIPIAKPEILYRPQTNYISDIDYEDYHFETEVEVPQMLNLEQPYQLEDQLQAAKEKIAQHIIGCIHVDAQQLLPRENYGRRYVRLSLRCQKKISMNVSPFER